MGAFVSGNWYKEHLFAHYGAVQLRKLPILAEMRTEVHIQYLSSGIPTRRHAMNDTPTVQPHYCAEIQTEDRWYCHFFYEEYGQVYIEIYEHRNQQTPGYVQREKL